MRTIILIDDERSTEKKFSDVSEKIFKDLEKTLNEEANFFSEDEGL